MLQENYYWEKRGPRTLERALASSAMVQYGGFLRMEREATAKSLFPPHESDQLEICLRLEGGLQERWRSIVESLVAQTHLQVQVSCPLYGFRPENEESYGFAAWPSWEEFMTGDPLFTDQFELRVEPRIPLTPPTEAGD